MKPIEALEAYKNDMLNSDDIGEICIYGGLAGGPGFIGFGDCKHNNHPNVRYSQDLCPKDCPDFKIMSDKNIMSQLICMSDYSSYYRDKYPADIEELRLYKKFL